MDIPASLLNRQTQQNETQTALPAPPKGWISVGENRGSFFGVNEALDACQKIAKSYLDQYKYVVCEPIMRIKKELIRWSEVHHQEDFVGVTVNRHIYAEERGLYGEGEVMGFGFNGSFDFRAPNNSVTIDETSNPIIVQKPVRIEMYREEKNVSYGYRILVRTPLILNSEPNMILWDSAQPDEIGDVLTFASAEDALTYGNREWMNFRGFDYYLEAIKIYTTSEGRFAFQIIGKKKFLNR